MGFPLDSILRFQKNRREEISRVITKVNQKIEHEKLEYGINRAAPKVFALSSGKINKYGYLTDEKMLPPRQHKIVEQAKFTFLPLDNALGKQVKTIEELGEKHKN